MSAGRTLPWDWYPGTIPDNVVIDDTAYVETSFSFYLFRSQMPCGVKYGRGASTYLGTMFDVGPRGRVAALLAQRHISVIGLDASAAIMRWYISVGSQAESASTVRPEGSSTVPVTSCRFSVDLPAPE